MINKTLIDLLLSSAEAMQNEVISALHEYRTNRDKERETSQMYKKEYETKYFEGKQSFLAECARERIGKAERIFRNKAEDCVKQMESQLKTHLHEPINEQFREKLKMISDFGIIPEKIEIDDLLLLNKGNQVGLEALRKTLDKVGCTYTVKFHSTKDFENDIATIKNMVRNMKYIPNEYYSEACEIFKNQNFSYTYDNGNTLSMFYDSQTLLKLSVGYGNCISEIKGMRDIWAKDCSYEVADRNSEGETGLSTEENTEIKSGTTIEDNPNYSEGIRIAKELGQRSARNAEIYNQVMGMAK